jgi:hypothetical protein
MRKEHLLYSLNSFDTDIFEDMEESVMFIDEADYNASLEDIDGDYHLSGEDEDEFEESPFDDSSSSSSPQFSLDATTYSEEEIIDINQITTYVRDLSTITDFANYYQYTDVEDLDVQLYASPYDSLCQEIDLQGHFRFLLYCYFIPAFFLTQMRFISDFVSFFFWREENIVGLRSFHKDGFIRIKYYPYRGSTLLSYAEEGCFYEMEDFYLQRLFFRKWATRRVTPPEYGFSFMSKVRDYKKRRTRTLRYFFYDRRKKWFFKRHYMYNFDEFSFQEPPYFNESSALNLLPSYDNQPFDLVYSSIMLQHHRLYWYIYYQYADLRYSDYMWRKKKYGPRPPAKKRFDDPYELEIFQLEKLLNIPKSESYFNPRNADIPYRPKTGSPLLISWLMSGYGLSLDPFDDLGFDV